jgi:ComF family protein
MLRCPHCRHQGEDAPRFSRAAALHLAPLREAIHAFKYENRPEFAPLLARYLVAVFATPPWTTLPTPITGVVPVPLHAERLAARGYNQAHLLATHFCERVGLPLEPTWLARTRDTPHQVGLNLRDRQANVQGAFAATSAVAGQSVLLIDDVYTTGSTLAACVAALRGVGAHAVYALTLAQPVRRASPVAGVERETEQDGSADNDDASWWEGEV